MAVNVFSKLREKEKVLGRMGPALRRYLVEFLGSMLAYALILVASIWLLKSNPEAAWRIPVALAPMVPAVFVMASVLRFVRRMDELQQRMQLEALAFSFCGTALATFAYGFLQGIGFPMLNWTLVWPVMASFWIIGLVRSHWRYR